MNTLDLHKETGVPIWTIRRVAKFIGGVPVGGTTGYVFPAGAPASLRAYLRITPHCLRG